VLKNIQLVWRKKVEGVEIEARRHPIRRKFWAEVIKAMNDSPSQLYQNISPGKEGWISAGTGTRGLGLNFAATKSYARAELYIDRGEREENKKIFDSLEQQKQSIEEEFGGTLIWERLDDKRACRIKYQQEGNIFEPDQWPEMINFMVDAMVRLEKALKPRVQRFTR
jgi:Domain of unknown function (DUF4268)